MKLLCWLFNWFKLRVGIQERFSKTDRALEEVPTWPNVNWMLLFKTSWWNNFFLDWPVLDNPEEAASGNNWSRWVGGFQVKTEVSDSAWGFQVASQYRKLQIISYPFRVKVREGRIGEITEILAWYEYINDVILDHLDDEIKSTDRSGVWRYLISFKVCFWIIFVCFLILSVKNLLRAIENIGIVSVYGIRYLTTGNVTTQNYIK